MLVPSPHLWLDPQSLSNENIAHTSLESKFTNYPYQHYCFINILISKTHNRCPKSIFGRKHCSGRHHKNYKPQADFEQLCLSLMLLVHMPKSWRHHDTIMLTVRTHPIGVWNLLELMQLVLFENNLLIGHPTDIFRFCLVHVLHVHAKWENKGMPSHIQIPTPLTNHKHKHT